MRRASIKSRADHIARPPPCQPADPYRRSWAATSAKNRRTEAAPNGGSACGYAKTCSPHLTGRQRYARARVRLHLDPGHCDCRDRAGGGPVPIQPLPGDTQFAQIMPELDRQHRYMGAAPNPRTLTGWSGASSHGLRLPVRAFLRFPVCPPGLFPFVRLPPVSLRPALSGSVPSAVAVRFGSPSVSLRVPFPLSNLHVSAAARRFCGRWSRAAGTKVTSSRRDPWLRSRRPACNADVPREDRVARRGGSAGRPHHRYT